MPPSIMLAPITNTILRFSDGKPRLGRSGRHASVPAAG